MMQTYSGNTALSPPSEEIVHHRKGGWFITYKKVLSFIVLIVVIVIVAGLIGWNLGTMPKTRVSDRLNCCDAFECEKCQAAAQIQGSNYADRYSKSSMAFEELLCIFMIPMRAQLPSAKSASSQTLMSASLLIRHTIP